MSIAHAIESSIVEDRKVWLDWSIDDESELYVACDDSIDYESRDGLVLEFWGERDGKYWVVCLVRPVTQFCDHAGNPMTADEMMASDGIDDEADRSRA